MNGNQPLSRFKVLDLTRVRAGPSAVRQLAGWGADVIKVEMPADEDDGGYSGTRHSADFQNLHRNKRSMTLDLKATGKEILRKLIAQSDVLVENYRPDVKYWLGIDYESLRQINPRLVYASISGFGQDGPYAKRPGVDQIAQGMSGFMSVTGHPEHGPTRAGAAIGDVSSGLYCSIGFLIALLEREVSGEGQWVQASSMFVLLDFQAAGSLFDRKLPRQAGNDHPKLVPTGTFRTKDGWINMGCNQQRWLPMCRAMGVEELARRPGFSTREERLRNRECVNAALTEVFATRTGAEWVEILNDAGVPRRSLILRSGTSGLRLTLIIRSSGGVRLPDSQFACRDRGGPSDQLRRSRASTPRTSCGVLATKTLTLMLSASGRSFNTRSAG